MSSPAPAETPPLLLLTWNILPEATTHLALSAPLERAIAHLEGLIAWLAEPQIPAILIIKNCRARLHHGILEQLAAQHGKTLHLWQTPPCPHAAPFGKGYGEGQMLLHALRHCPQLRSASHFLKCTGKLFAPRWHSLCQTAENTRAQAAFPLTENPTPTRALLPCAFFRSPLLTATLDILRRRARLPWPLAACACPQLVDTRLYWCHTPASSKPTSPEPAPPSANPSAAPWKQPSGSPSTATPTSASCPSPPIILRRSGTLGTSAAPFPEPLSNRARELAPALLLEPH